MDDSDPGDMWSNGGHGRAPRARAPEPRTTLSFRETQWSIRGEMGSTWSVEAGDVVRMGFYSPRLARFLANGAGHARVLTSEGLVVVAAKHCIATVA